MILNDFTPAGNTKEEFDGLPVQLMDKAGEVLMTGSARLLNPAHRYSFSVDQGSGKNRQSLPIDGTDKTPTAFYEILAQRLMNFKKMELRVYVGGTK